MNLAPTTAGQFGLLLEENQPMLIMESALSGDTFRLSAVGDISLGARLRRHYDEPSAAVSGNLRGILGSSDCSFANLECALSTGNIEGPFVAAVNAMGIVDQLQITHLHIANNHISDAGQEGFSTTLAELGQRNITALGIESENGGSRLEISLHKGVRVGWLACGRTGLRQSREGPHFVEYDRESIVALTREAQGQVDVLIVSLHIGFMYVDYPDPEHRSLAHDLVSAGANLVLMHHPHVLQGIETVGPHGLICYSLGNFLVDWTAGYLKHDTRVREQTEGAVFLFDIDSSGVRRVGIVPTRISADCRVEVATGERGDLILDRIAQVSRDLSGDYLPKYRRQRAQFNTALGLRTLSSVLRHQGFMSFLRHLRRVRPAHLRMLARWAMGSH